MEKIDMDEPLFKLVSSTGEVPISVRTACNGFFLLGGIGSGKTTSSGALLATKMLEKKWGGLVLTVKNSERDAWIRYCEQTGRSNDLKVLEPGGHHSFNWLSYLSGKSNGAELTDNIVDVIKTVVTASEQKNTGGSDGNFFDGALDQVLSFSVELLKRAYGDGGVTVERLYELMQTLPKPNIPVKPQEGQMPSAFWTAYSTVKVNLKKSIKQWEEKLGAGHIASLQQRGLYMNALIDACPDYRPVKHLDDFFLDTYRNLSSRTRSVVDFMVSGCLFRMMKEPVFSLLSNGPSTVIPELVDRGKIILVNLPTKEFSKVGRDAQVLVKFIFQKALEARKMHDNTRPAFIFVDEAQEVLTPYDVDFQATSRSNRVISVFISQNLNNYIAVMGGNQPENKVMALAGVFGNKIFHANADQRSNEYASELCGEDWYPEFNEGTTIQDKFQFSHGTSYRLRRNLLPQDFQKLKTGGPMNNFITEAVIHVQGTPLFDGENFIKASFRQII